MTVNDKRTNAMFINLLIPSHKDLPPTQTRFDIGEKHNYNWTQVKKTTQVQVIPLYEYANKTIVMKPMDILSPV